MPTAHPKFQMGKMLDCPLEDTVVHILWIIRHMPKHWERVVKIFGSNGLHHEMELTEYAQWTAIDNTVDRFYNGLELAVWFWTIREGFS